MMRVLLIALSSLAAAACGSGRDPAPAEPKIAVRGEEQDQLHQLDDPMRDIALKRAIAASGTRCQRVTRSGYVTEHGNLSMWSASCSDNRQWAIFVGPDGTAQVRPCEQMAQFDLPACSIADDPSGRKARGLTKQG